MRFFQLLSLLAAFQCTSVAFRPIEAQTVQAVLFFSPTCPHCHDVITQYLPGLFENFGGTPRASVDSAVSDQERALYLFSNGRLAILLVDASKATGTELYLASTENQSVPPERTGVPRLVIGDVYLVGSLEIPEQTGELVRQGLEQGGLGWPAVDGLREAIASIPGALTAVVTTEVDSTSVSLEEADDSSSGPLPAAVKDTATPPVSAPDTENVFEDDSVPTSSPTSPEEAQPTPAADTSDSNDIAEPEPAVMPDTQSVFEAIQARQPTMIENFLRDPVGNAFSVVILLFMLASIVVMVTKSDALPASWVRGVGIPILAMLGAVVASYLTYVEATGATAVCGPVGDCNTVNQSEWARLFGVLPVGALGLMGYVAIAVAWSTSKYASERTSTWASLALLVMTAAGTVFSIYLTFLEPFVIGATCAWCLTSSVAITILMWLSAGAGRESWVQIRENSARRD